MTMVEENNDSPSVFYTVVADALAEILKSANSPEIRQAQLMLMRRLALSGDVVPSRIPPPINITEIGGYLNMFEALQLPEFRRQVLASIFGVAGPSPPIDWFPAGPTLFFATRPNDRPAGAMVSAIPVPVQLFAVISFLYSILRLTGFMQPGVRCRSLVFQNIFRLPIPHINKMSTSTCFTIWGERSM